MFSADSLSLSSLKNNIYILQHIQWEFEPSQLMEPRIGNAGKGSGAAPFPSGYILYIETIAKNPGLFLMMQNAAGYAETIAKINGVPDHLLAEAVEENKNREYFKMYPINKKLREWLEKELGVER